MHRSFISLVVLTALPVLAQAPAPPPRPERRVVPSPPNRVLGAVPDAVPAGVPPAGVPPAPTATPAPGTVKAPKPTCEEVRKKARYNIYFEKVDIEKLVQQVSDATCKTFILPENVRGKITIVGPENGRAEVDGEGFYAAFLAALDANSLSLYPHGKFLKIVDKQRAKQFPIPLITDPEAAYTLNEQMVTRMFKLKYAEVEQVRGVLQQLVSPSGDTIPFQPDTIIVNDLGSNIHRLEKVVEQLDSRSSSDEVRVLQIRYATAQEIADKVQKLFENKGARPGQRPGSIAPLPAPAPPGAPPPPAAPGAAAGADGSSGGPATLSQLIPDERTNKLIVVASPAALERIMGLIREIDVPIADGGGRINVYYLENANAEELQNTLNALTQGTANRPKAVPGAPPPPAGAPRTSTAAELFQGEVKVSADKTTNSLVIIASQNDYRSMVRVIEKLDIPRRQVFIEAVIMEVNLDRNTELGVNLHTGATLPSPTGGERLPVVFGTKYTGQSVPPSLNLASIASFGGFLAGLQGPMVPNLSFGGVQIPAFGLVLHALQVSSDVNVLSTPHILTSDNEEAEFVVGQTIPFVAAPTAGLGGLSGLASALPGTTGANSLLGGLGGLGGLGALGALGGIGIPQRLPVELKLSVKPQINDSDFVRLVINEQVEDVAPGDNTSAGPPTSKRSAKTTVVAKDQETVVIGGIMQERTLESVNKVPILGDIPLLGHLFRSQTHKKVKTNLLLFLTPYIIKDSSDFRRIFERKLKERQQFVEQFYGQVGTYDVAIDFSRKAGPLAKMTQVLNKEMNKLENGGPGSPGEKLILPGGTAAPTNPAPTPASPAPSPEGATPPGNLREPVPGNAPDAPAPVPAPPATPEPELN
ncbi:MAG: type II secretion system secretin GspD [Myxococcaceae bacterium]|nr:type II secretion system secretin GspD [Myxococcaceae bacterium]